MRFFTRSGLPQDVLGQVCAVVWCTQGCADHRHGAAGTAAAGASCAPLPPWGVCQRGLLGARQHTLASLLLVFALTKQQLLLVAADLGAVQWGQGGPQPHAVHDCTAAGVPGTGGCAGRACSPGGLVGLWAGLGCGLACHHQHVVAPYLSSRMPPKSRVGPFDDLQWGSIGGGLICILLGAGAAPQYLCWAHVLCSARMGCVLTYASACRRPPTMSSPRHSSVAVKGGGAWHSHGCV